MAYAFKVHRVTISGTCYGGAEIWSTGLFLGNESADAGTASQAQVDAIAARWQTFFTDTNAGINNSYLTTQVKVALLNTDGTTDPLNVVYHPYTTAIAGANSVNKFPAQCSMVASLHSSLVRGPASKGRMFLPGFAKLVATDGHISSTDVGNLATSFQTFINGVNTDASSTAKVINASFGRTTPTVVAGVNKLITSALIGNVVDTQRRRRNGLVETYTSKPIT